MAAPPETAPDWAAGVTLDARGRPTSAVAPAERRSQTLGVILLEAVHAVDTLDLADPFAWEPPPGLTPGFFGHPGAWPLPTLFVVAEHADAAAVADAQPEALAGVARAVARLDGRCDLIVGGCGFFAYAWDVIATPPATPTLLSGLDLLDEALRFSDRDVAVLSFSEEPCERFLARRADRHRLRTVPITPAGDWPKLAVTTYATEPTWTLEGLEDGLREVLVAQTAPGGALHDIGALVVECTIVPMFRRLLREHLTVPIFDAATAGLSLLA